MSLTHYAADELVRRRRHYQTLVNGKGYSAENIACEGAAFGEEALAAEALRTIHPARFTKRDESAQMDKHRMQEQAHYLYARMSQGVEAADLLLCMHAKGEGRFAEHVLQKLEEKEQKRKRSVPSSPTEEDIIKPSPSTKKNKKRENEEAPKKQPKAKLQGHDDAFSSVKPFDVPQKNKGTPLERNEVGAPRIDFFFL